MKTLFILTALLPASFASVPVVDDPEPEPIDCPLCGGDPMIHVRRMFGMTRVASDIVSFSLRW